jgi:hypothetical protein
MRGNSHVRFLGGGVMATSPCYPTVLDEVSGLWMGGSTLSFPSSLPKLQGQGAEG